jgi:hypothetical protein
MGMAGPTLRSGRLTADPGVDIDTPTSVYQA